VPDFPQSYLDDILNAIMLRISLIGGLPPQVRRKKLAMSPTDGKYVVVVAPETDAMGETQAFLGQDGRRSGEILYTIQVGVLSQGNTEYEQDDPFMIGCRELLRQRLNEPTLVGATGNIFNMNLQLGAIYDDAALGQAFTCSSFRVEVSSVEPMTGLLVSNQAGM
jgi:hypothetical protein